MDGRSYRERSSDRRVINGAEPSATPSPTPSSRVEESQPAPAAKEEPRVNTTHRTERVHVPSFDDKRGPRRRWWLPVSIAVAVLVLGFLGWTLVSGLLKGGSGIDSTKYQAVFFTNGQVYFGKLHTFNDDYLKMTDIYYLQAQSSSDSNPQQTSSDNNNVQLIKLGQEVHGPEDEMIISRDQVLFYENLKADGKVAQSIDQYKAK